MLEEQDIKKIGEVVDDRLGALDKRLDGRFEKTESLIIKTEGRIIEAVGEMIEQNVLPAIVSLPDKAYLDDKLADLEGATVVRQRYEIVDRAQWNEFLLSQPTQAGIFCNLGICNVVCRLSLAN